MKPLHVDFCLKTQDKKLRILAALPIHRCPLYFYSIICNGPERNGTELIGTENQTTQLCWNMNDQVFNKCVFVQMIVNDKNEFIACSLLPRDMGQKASYFGCLANPQSFYIIIWNGPERNGKTDRHLQKKLQFSVPKTELLEFVQLEVGKVR